MEKKFINRYNSFCKCLENLKKSLTANPLDDFVLEGTTQNFNLTFDLSWKVMKDILVKAMGVTDYRRNKQEAFNKAHNIKPQSVSRKLDENLKNQDLGMLYEKAKKKEKIQSC